MNSVNPFHLAGVAVNCAENIVQFQPPRPYQRCFVGLARSDIARNDDLCAPGTCAAVRLWVMCTTPDHPRLTAWHPPGGQQLTNGALCPSTHSLAYLHRRMFPSLLRSLCLCLPLLSFTSWLVLLTSSNRQRWLTPALFHSLCLIKNCHYLLLSFLLW